MKNLILTFIIFACFAVGAYATTYQVGPTRTPRSANGVIDIGAYEF